MKKKLPISPHVLKRLGILMLCMAMGASSLWAQTTNASSLGSDYSITLTYTNVPANNCDCSTNGQDVIALELVPGILGIPRMSESNISSTGSKIQGGFGPSYSAAWKVIYSNKGEEKNVFGTCVLPPDCDNTYFSDLASVTTSAIKNPTGLDASDNEGEGSRLDQIKITWGKGTDIPNADHKYKIYRDNTLIATLDGDEREYTDTGLAANTNYTYKVATYTPAWGVHESGGATNVGKTDALILTISQGTFANKTKISWKSVAKSSDNIRIERSIPTAAGGGWEELGILNKNATAYTDTDPIPGFLYTYRASALDGNGDDLQVVTGTGFRKPNGIIKGQVVSTGGAGVANVTITVQPKTNFPGNKMPAPGVNTGPLTATTGPDGYYEVRDLYYYDEADFTISPSYSNHGFAPALLERLLDENTSQVSAVNFTDTTAITIGGNIVFQDAATLDGSPGNCGVEEASILINGIDFGILTDKQGDWSYALSDSGNYVFKPVFKHHAFNLDSLEFNIGTDKTDLDFVNVQVDSIEIFVQGGCNTSVTNPAFRPVTVNIDALVAPGCYNDNVSTSNTGYKMLVLPATKYELEVAFSAELDPNAWNQFKDTSFVLDLSTRDSVQRVISDTTFLIIPPRTLPNGTTVPGSKTVQSTKDTIVNVSLQPTARFIYFRPFEVTTDFEGAGAEVIRGCSPVAFVPTDSVILFNQGANYLLPIRVVEQTTLCPVDTGSIVVYDFLSNKGNSPISIPIKNGFAFYPMEVQEPNTAAGGNQPYEELLYFVIEAGTRPPQPVTYWGLIEGAEQLTPTFTTRSPEIPRLILHDPPGSNSYAWVEEGSSFSQFEYTQYENSGSGGLYVDATIGSVVSLFGVELFKAGVQFKLDLEAGRENYDRTGYVTSVNFTERYSTSSDPLFTGYDGDVYIGMATNQLFSIARVLRFDKTTCSTAILNDPNMEETGIATTFIYSEGHIKNILISQLDFLSKSFAHKIQFDGLVGQDSIDIQIEIDSLLRDVYNWNNILAYNARNRNPDSAAVFVENISFSAGAEVDFEETRDTTYSGSYEYVTFVDIGLSVGGRFETGIGPWVDAAAGVTGKFRHSYTNEVGGDTTDSRTIGYHLEDNDLGDFFSINILDDVAYDVPAFDLFAGTSSCPHEFGTQPRDRVSLAIDKPRVDNIPIGGEAVFQLSITNKSESFETREYQLRVIAQTNPDGALVRLGGQLINNSTASFFIDDNQTINVAMTVKQGPAASNYKFAIMAYPPCEYDLWASGGNVTSGDTIWVEVNFQSQCSNVAISSPSNNWLVNGNSNNQLVVDLTGYDINNPFLESVAVEYREEGKGWRTGPTVLASELIDVFYRVFWDVNALPDGDYEIRARANCSDGRGFTLSNPFSGVVDRRSLGPFGIPTPSDGFLRLGQSISVAFDKDIDCRFRNAIPTYTPSITLMRADDSTFFTLTTQCSDKQLILIPDVDLFNMPQLAGVTLIARVEGIQDEIGNIQDYPIAWAFRVNASPVFWDPDSLNEAFAAGAAPTISSRLKNTAGLSKAFTITDYPAWLTPAVLSGSILADGEYEVNFFVSPDLPIGMYRDTVVATIDGFPEFLDINYEAVAIPPNWSVDPSDYDYSMNVVAVFSLDQTDTNLSRSDKDLIAAVYNGETRGVAQLEYVARFNKYIAFLTVYSNTIANEEINFSLWRAANGVEYTAKETLYFQNDQVYGRMNNPEIFHTDGVYQVIPLDQGWNWVSLNVDNSDMTVQNLLNSLGSPSVGNDVTIKRKDGQTAQFTQIATPLIFSNQWTGPLVQLDNKQGYLLYLSDEPDTLRIPGKPISTFDPIDMLSGWNWIGFQPQVAQPVDQALNSVNVRNGDLLKSQDAFSEYHKGWDTWYGPLQFMEPGQGYKLRLRTGVNYNDLMYSNRLGKDDYAVDHSVFESNMTIVAKIGFDEKLGLSRGQLASDRLLIGAFIDDTCRGYGFLEWVDFMDDYRAVLSAHGNISDVGREMTFRVYDSHSGQEFICPNSPETYISDYFLGNVREPYVLFDQLDLPNAGYFLEQNYPNPYDSKTNIRFILPQQERVKLSVYDQFGKVVQVLIDEELTAGEHTAVFDGSKLPSGVYHYSLQAGEYRASRKMVKF